LINKLQLKNLKAHLNHLSWHHLPICQISL
jgi:hypothetical protein